MATTFWPGSTIAADNSDEMMWGWQSKIKNSSERSKFVLESDFHSDVTFRVGPMDGETVDIKAHKFMLATGSTVFETMFYGNIPEKRSIIPITDIDPESFRILLRYLYHQQIGPFNTTTAFPALYGAKKYGLPILKDACDRYLRANVNAENCLAWLVEAEIYDEPKLAELFLSKIDSQGPLVFQSDDFLEVNNGTLMQILSRDSLKAREVDVYDAAIRWAKNRCAEQQIDVTGVNLRAALGNALFLVRFPIMTFHEVSLGPVKLGLLNDDETEQLRCWFTNETLPGNFNITRRHISAELHIKRFGGTQYDGWTYAAGRANAIKFTVGSPLEIDVVPFASSRLCIASMTDKAYRNVDSPSVSLVAIGFYLSSVIPAPYVSPSGEYCSKCGNYSAPRARPRSPQPSTIISMKVYVGEGADQRELYELRQTFCPLAGYYGDRVEKIHLNKPVPLKPYQRYTISAEMTDIQKSYYGTEGKSRVILPTSSGDLNVALEFSSVSEANENQSYDAYYRGTRPSGITSVAQGQFPEFYFEVIG